MAIFTSSPLYCLQAASPFLLGQDREAELKPGHHRLGQNMIKDNILLSFNVKKRKPGYQRLSAQDSPYNIHFASWLP